MPNVVRWTGERNRPPRTQRPCSCGCDARAGLKGVGYATMSDGSGNGLTVWFDTEEEYAAAEKDPLGALNNHLQ